MLGDARPREANAPRTLGQHAGDDRLRRRADVGRLAGEHLVRQRAERVDVGAAVDDAIARRLLGAHVLRRAERQSGLRDARAAGVGDGEGDAEVGDERLAFLEEDVLRLQIAVDDALAVGVVERAGDRRRDAHGLIDRELLLADEAGAERLALDVRHHIEEHLARRAGIEERQQVGMLEIRGDLDLGLEPIDTDDRAEVGAQDLERDAAIVANVPGQINLGHAAFADEAFDRVASLRIIHSATTTLMTQPAPISTALADSSGLPTRMKYGRCVNTCVAAPIPMA